MPHRLLETNYYLSVELPENFECFLVDDVEQMIVENVKTDHSNQPVSFIRLQATLT